MEGKEGGGTTFGDGRREGEGDRGELAAGVAGVGVSHVSQRRETYVTLGHRVLAIE